MTDFRSINCEDFLNKMKSFEETIINNFVRCLYIFYEDIFDILIKTVILKSMMLILIWIWYTQPGHCLMSKVFTNGPRDQSSILGWVIPKTQKWYLMPPSLILSNMYRSRIKWSNPEKVVTPSPTPRCSSYWKGSLQVTLDKGHQL